MIINVKGIAIVVNGADAQGQAPGRVRGSGWQTAQIARTLDLLPVDHLRLIPPITIGERPPSSGQPGSYGGGGSAHRGMAGGPYIRMNWRAFQAPWNQGQYNYTLLHEIGHIVDWAYECMESMLREDPPGYRALLAHPHSGRTQGPGEHYADAYADYFTGGRISEGRRTALLNSRAFAPNQSG